jgi:hypothetical protein
MKKLLYLVLVLISGLGACNSGSHEEIPITADTTFVTPSEEVPVVEEPTATLEKRQLKGLDLSISLEDKMQVQDYGDFQMVCTSENVKDAKCFTIEPYKSSAKTYLSWGKETLNEGKVFYYKTSQEVSPNGGKDENLEGVVLIKNKSYLIKSSDHNASGLPDAKWCIPYLKSISEE